MTQRRRITFLVLDLDNTLWDWFEIWHSAFAPFIKGLSEKTGISINQLKAEIKVVHQRHGTSEYAFVLEELPSLQQRHGVQFNANDYYNELIAEYQRHRNEASRLYPGVFATLTKIGATGCRIVGYTESLAFYTSQRIRAMGLDGLLEAIYSPPDHDIPTHLTEEQVRRYGPETYALKVTAHRATPVAIVKPDTRVLASIVRDAGVPLSEVAYVGDNLAKDVVMAKRLCVAAVHAKYGESHKDGRYKLLVEVSHWPDQAVKEQAALTAAEVVPDAVLHTSIEELHNYFEFEAPETRTVDEQRTLMEAWKQTVDTQQHFNDLQLRLRTVMITLLVAVFGATAFALKEHTVLTVFGNQISAAAIVCAAGLVGIVAFYYMDYGYQHLLLGAVKHGERIEQSAGAQMKHIRLAQSIRQESPTPPIWFLFLRMRWYERLKTAQLPAWFRKSFVSTRNSTRRLRFFYQMNAILMIVVLVFMQIVGIGPSSGARDGQGAVAGEVKASASCGDDALRNYFTGYAYKIALNGTCDDALKIMDQAARESREASDLRPLAMVLDIDETALSTWAILDSGSFCWDEGRFDAYVASAQMPAIDTTLLLFHQARARHVACFFITSRGERHREATVDNLNRVGYRGFAGLYMKPDESTEATAEFKARIRGQIEENGYRIILNIGDQVQDLVGAHAERHVLMPNPFYTTR